MSWGYKVTILALSFVAFMTFLVISAFRQNFDLVTEDYYGRELQFQSQIDKQKNQERLKESVHVEQQDQALFIRFPQDLSGKKIYGEILLFRPSDASKDIKIKIAAQDGIQGMDKKRLIKGLYRLQIDYGAGAEEFYFEDDLIVY